MPPAAIETPSPAMSVLKSHLSSYDQLLANNINQAEWFVLHKNYSLYKDSVNDYIRNVASSLLVSYFGHPEEAVKEIQSLMDKYGGALGESQVSFIILLAENEALLGNYSKAANIYQSVLAQGEGVLDKTLVDKMRGNERLYTALAKVENRSVSVNDSVILPIEVKDQVVYVDMELEGKKIKTILDTGATEIAIDEKLAKLLKVSVLADSVFVNDGSYMKFGIFKELKLGNSILHNIPCIILPDGFTKGENKRPLDFQAILGLSVLKRFGSLIIDFKELLLTLGKKNLFASMEEPNLCWMNKLLYTNVRINNEAGIFQFDTGNKGGVMVFNSFYKAHKDAFPPLGDLTSKTMIHLEGNSVIDFYPLAKCKFQVNNNEKLVDVFIFSETSSQLMNYLSCSGIIGIPTEPLENIKIDFNNLIWELN